MINIRNLKKHFSFSQGPLKAVDGVSLTIEEGQTLGLVGESGCGKSTLGRTLLRLYEPTEGEFWFQGLNVFSFSERETKSWRKSAQMIFQDPYASLNPRMTAEDLIVEPLKIHGLPYYPEQIIEMFKKVHLNPSHRKRYPHEFSGGQRQRIGIARALMLNPRFMICDEPIAALDVSIQAQIINLLKKLQQEHHLTYLFISHDLRMVHYLADQIAVMYLGKIVETGSSRTIFQNPSHPYTQALLSAIPRPELKVNKNKPSLLLKGDIHRSLSLPKGCRFCCRCPKAMSICQEVEPVLQTISSGHQVACHLFNPTILPMGSPPNDLKCSS